MAGMPRSLRLAPFALWIVLLVAGLGEAAGAGTTGAPPGRQELEQLLGQGDAILARIGSLRGLDAPQGLPRAIRSRDAIVARVLELVRDRYPGPQLEAERKALAAFALIPPGFSLETFLTDMAGEQVAAYFDHLTGEIVLADWLPAAIQAPVLVHELVHALQGRHLDLRKFIERRPGRGDGLLARHALLEGEATAIMIELALQAMGLDATRAPSLGSLADLAAGAGSPILGAAPKFLRDQLLFPYSAGANFVTAFRRRHPWPAFSRLYADPPRSTAQILHPEKYLDRRDDPQLVLLPDVRGLLGPGWTLVVENDAGEFGVRSILERFLPEAEAGTAAAGWGGDRFQLYERGGGVRRALVFLTAWDTEADAREFADAYARLVPKKVPAARSGRGAGGRWTWRHGRDVLVVEPQGADVLVMEGVPRGRAERVRHWVWRLRAAHR